MGVAKSTPSRNSNRKPRSRSETLKATQSGSKTQKIIRPPEQKSDKVYTCNACGKEFKAQYRNFTRNKSPYFAGNNGYIDVCRNCVQSFYDQYVEKYGNTKEAEERALERIAMRFDFYINDTLSTNSEKMKMGETRLDAFFRNNNLAGNNLRTYDERLEEKEKNERRIVINSPDDFGEETDLTQDDLQFWGVGYQDDELIWLKNEYEDWKSRHICKTKAQEENIKLLCKIQLQIQKAATNNATNIDRLVSSYNTILKSSSLSPQQAKDNLAENNTWGTLIKKWENTKPIPEPDPEWKDVDGIKKYINVYFLGHLCKMLGVENSYSKMYDEEMEEYTVTRPEYQQPQDEDESQHMHVFKKEDESQNG